MRRVRSEITPSCIRSWRWHDECTYGEHAANVSQRHRLIANASANRSGVLEIHCSARALGPDRGTGKRKERSLRACDMHAKPADVSRPVRVLRDCPPVLLSARGGRPRRSRRYRAGARLGCAAKMSERRTAEVGTPLDQRGISRAPERSTLSVDWRSPDLGRREQALKPAQPPVSFLCKRVSPAAICKPLT